MSTLSDNSGAQLHLKFTDDSVMIVPLDFSEPTTRKYLGEKILEEAAVIFEEPRLGGRSFPVKIGIQGEARIRKAPDELPTTPEKLRELLLKAYQAGLDHGAELSRGV